MGCMKQKQMYTNTWKCENSFLNIRLKVKAVSAKAQHGMKNRQTLMLYMQNIVIWFYLVYKQIRLKNIEKKISFHIHILLFLAHLSRRLTGELIVYPCSGVRPSSVRPSVVRLSQFQRSSPLKLLGQSKPNFMWSILRKTERKFI